MSEPQAAPEFVAVFEELDAGIFNRKVSAALAETAMAVVNAEDKSKKGTVTIQLELERIGEGAQVNMSHTIDVSRPTLRGKIREIDKTQTLLHVGKRGKMTITPDTQMDLIPRVRREIV